MFSVIADFIMKSAVLKFLFTLAVTATAAVVTQNEQLASARALISRIIPDRSGEFKVGLLHLPKQGDGHDAFEISSTTNPDGSTTVILKGTSGVAVASAFNHYLKYVANCHVSWAGDQLDLPSPLPLVDGAIKKERVGKHSYYLNVCTVSYTMVWWDWARWERELDWMAMQGVNTPLSFTGQEIVFLETFQKFGVNESSMQQFFSGPAFLAWQRMGNLQKWGGPLPKSFMEKQRDLQVKILRRQRELGMWPVGPLFVGFLPPVFEQLYPGTKVSYVNWNLPKPYNHVAIMSPDDKNFHKIGTTFIETLFNIYGDWSGPDGRVLLNGDQFNEMEPPSREGSYLKHASEIVWRTIDAAVGGNNGVWVMQGWFFVTHNGEWTSDQGKHYLSGIPDENLLILDLWSESKPQYHRIGDHRPYFGKPFTWNMLHDFGGAMGLFGNSSGVMNGLDSIWDASNFVGVGVTMEATLQNYPMYEMALELAWYDLRKATANDWFYNYATRRYNLNSISASSAHHVRTGWELLSKIVYSCSKLDQVPKSIMIQRPALLMRASSTNCYSSQDFMPIVYHFLQGLDDDGLANQKTFIHDVVDIVRQQLSNEFIVVHQQHSDAYASSNLDGVKSLAKKLLKIIKRTDDLLSNLEFFSFDHWVATAKSWADETTPENYYEWNARNQLTLWGPNGEISDYAAKEWAGLFSSYYLPRWTIYLEAVEETVKEGRPFDEVTYQKVVRAFEQQWQHQPGNVTLFAGKKSSDISVSVVKEICSEFFGLRSFIAEDRIIFV